MVAKCRTSRTDWGELALVAQELLQEWSTVAHTGSSEGFG